MRKWPFGHMHTTKVHISPQIVYPLTTLTLNIAKNSLRKIAIIFLSISLNMCFGCSKEPSHQYGSFEYPKHMFWLRNEKNNFKLRTL